MELLSDSLFQILEVELFEMNYQYQKDFKIDEAGSLQVQWSEGDHTSYYDPSWLRKNCYTLKNKSKYVPLRSIPTKILSFNVLSIILNSVLALKSNAPWSNVLES